MSLFQFVNVEAVNTEAQDAEVKTKVTVVEGRHQRVNLGVGYGTEENARVDAEYHHVNFLGGARSAGVHGRYSSLDRGLRLDFTQPYFFRPTFNLGAEGQRWYNYTPAYKSVITGGKISLTQIISSRTSWTVSMSSARTSTFILIPPEEQPLLYVDLIALGLDPDDLVAGRHAQRIRVRLATGDHRQRPERPEWLPDRRPRRASGKAVAGHVQLLIDFGRRALLSSDRQASGGGQPAAAGQYSSVWLRPGECAVLQEVFSGRRHDACAGGDGMKSARLVERACLLAATRCSHSALSCVRRSKESSAASLFLDAGNVWTDFRAIDLGTIRYAVGTGLRYQTPVGPIRLDLAIQLNPIPGLQVNGQPQIRPWRVHFSIGQAF